MKTAESSSLLDGIASRTLQLVKRWLPRSNQNSSCTSILEPARRIMSGRTPRSDLHPQAQTSHKSCHCQRHVFTEEAAMKLSFAVLLAVANEMARIGRREDGSPSGCLRNASLGSSSRRAFATSFPSARSRRIPGRLTLRQRRFDRKPPIEGGLRASLTKRSFCQPSRKG